MPRKESKAVPEGNGPTSQDAGRMVKWEELRRTVSETWGGAFREFEEKLRRIDQRLAGLEQDARQPRLAMEVDVPADTKTRERTEGAAKVVQAMHGDSFSSKRIQDGPKSSTSPRPAKKPNLPLQG